MYDFFKKIILLIAFRCMWWCIFLRAYVPLMNFFWYYLLVSLGLISILFQYDGSLHFSFEKHKHEGISFVFVFCIEVKGYR